MSGRHKWRDLERKATPEQVARARAELDAHIRRYEAAERAQARAREHRPPSGR